MLVAVVATSVATVVALGMVAWRRTHASRLRHDAFRRTARALEFRHDAVDHYGLARLPLPSLAGGVHVDNATWGPVERVTVWLFDVTATGATYGVVSVGRPLPTTIVVAPDHLVDAEPDLRVTEHRTDGVRIRTDDAEFAHQLWSDPVRSILTDLPRWRTIETADQSIAVSIDAIGADEIARAAAAVRRLRDAIGADRENAA